MATLAEAMADTSALGDFEGKDVRRAGVEIPGVAGGLRKSLKIKPRRFEQGEEAWIAFRVVTQKVRFDPIDKDKPGGDQERVHIFVVLGSAFVDAKQVQKAIEAEAERILKAEEEAKGINQLPMGDADFYDIETESE